MPLSQCSSNSGKREAVFDVNCGNVLAPAWRHEVSSRMPSVQRSGRRAPGTAEARARAITADATTILLDLTDAAEFGAPSPSRERGGVPHAIALPRRRA